MTLVALVRRRRTREDQLDHRAHWRSSSTWSAKLSRKTIGDPGADDQRSLDSSGACTAWLETFVNVPRLTNKSCVRPFLVLGNEFSFIATSNAIRCLVTA